MEEKQKEECKNQQQNKDCCRLKDDSVYYYDFYGLNKKYEILKKRLKVIHYLNSNGIHFNLVPDVKYDDYIIEIDLAKVSKKDFDILINEVL
tara:strand:+ start:9024 stop:9299 length:276 start_codon:yes stop_codon:yes gene_type:complete